MNPIEIRGSENSVSHPSKIMERKKYERKGKDEIAYANEARQSNFCTTTFSRFREGVLREEVGEFTCAFTCVRRPWKRMNSHEWSNDSRFVRLSRFLPFGFSFLSYYELYRDLDGLSTVFMKADENAASVIDFAVVNDNQCLARWDFANGT